MTRRNVVHAETLSIPKSSQTARRPRGLTKYQSGSEMNMNKAGFLYLPGSQDNFEVDHGVEAHLTDLFDTPLVRSTSLRLAPKAYK